MLNKLMFSGGGTNTLVMVAGKGISGFEFLSESGYKSKKYGSLSPKTFTLKGKTYTVKEFCATTDLLRITITGAVEGQLIKFSIDGVKYENTYGEATKIPTSFVKGNTYIIKFLSIE